MRGLSFERLAVALLLGVLAAIPWPAAAAGPPLTERARADDLDWARARHYDVALSEFHFNPVRITLERGQPYALRLENKGRFRHTFTAPAFFHTVVFRPGGAATEAETSGGLSLGAGEVAEIEFVPLQAGTYAVECTKPLHGLFGMSGDILVQ